MSDKTKPELPYIELWEAHNRLWYFHKRNANNELTDASQGYTLRRSARQAARRDIPGLPIVFVTEHPYR